MDLGLIVFLTKCIHFIKIEEIFTFQARGFKADGLLGVLNLEKKIKI